MIRVWLLSSEDESRLEIVTKQANQVNQVNMGNQVNRGGGLAGLRADK